MGVPVCRSDDFGSAALASAQAKYALRLFHAVTALVEDFA
jgi:hypothetical protein